MNVLFYLEPAIELGNPEFRYATLRGAIVPQVIALRDAGVNVHTVVSEVIAECAMRDGNLAALASVSTIDPIDWVQGENTLERSLRHQAKNFLSGEVERLGDLVKRDLPIGFQPDIIIVWESPVSFLGDVFPGTRIIYQMPGFFSRPPYASLVSFDSGLLEDSQVSMVEEVDTIELDQLAELRKMDLRFIESISQVKGQLKELHHSFRNVVLFPLQIDGYFMINSVLGRRSQFDLLLEVIGNAPETTAIVVTNYWSGKTRSAVLTEQNIKYLRSRFKNFSYFEGFDNIPSVSQLLVPSADGVITVSSSLGYQAAFWQKPLITMGESHVSQFASATSWDEFYRQVNSGSPISRDALIVSTIKTRHLPSTLLSEDGAAYVKWLKGALGGTTPGFPEWPERTVGESLVGLRRESEYLKQLGYFDKVRNESSMDHCRELSQQILRYPIVSFDIFDTLLYRPFKSPSDMFELMSEEVQLICGLPYLDFKIARRSAEKAAFEKAIARGDGEVLIGEIYQEFTEQNALASEVAKEIQALEMQMEMDILYPRISGLKAFNEARSLGKRIILISDMYLPRYFLEAVLKKNGYEGYERFYLSSEVRLKKHNGKLFDHVLEDLAVKPDQILHVGDNLAADIVKAKDRGIKPFHLVKASEVFAACDSYKLPWLRDEARHTLDWKMTLAIVGNQFYDNPYYPHVKGTLFGGDPWRLGYYGQGPMLLGYAKWLIEKSIRDGVQRLYFLSRDGLIMKEAYDRIATNYPQAPSSHYLLCSRRAVNLAKVKDEYGVMDLLHVEFARTTLEHLLVSRFGVHKNDVPRDVLSKHGLTLESIVTKKDQESLKPFFLHLLPVIISAASKEREDYLEYLKSTGLMNDGNVALVDIGYAGTMQESLYQLTGKVKEIGGYYLITFRAALKRVDSYGLPIKGYLGEFVDRHDTHHPFCRHVPLYETLYSSADTSFVKIARDWKGRLTPVFMERFPAEAKREELVKTVHKGALAYIEQVSTVLGKNLLKLDIEPVKSLRILELFFSNPHPVDARMFSGVVFEDAYGGAGLKTILPLNNDLKALCVWKKGAEIMRESLEGNGDSIEIPAAVAVADTPAVSVTGPEPKTFNKIEHHIISWVIRCTSNDKKIKKFEKTPRKFFDDSKANYVKVIGRIYLARATD